MVITEDISREYFHKHEKLYKQKLDHYKIFNEEIFVRLSFIDFS